MPASNLTPEVPSVVLQETAERDQPWRNLPGMPAKDEDEEYENGTKGIVNTGDDIRLDCLADVGTNLGG